MTYKLLSDTILIKLLLILCYNNLTCQSLNPNYLNNKLFIDLTFNKLSKTKKIDTL